MTTQSLEDTSNSNKEEKPPKIDPITAVQDSIDGLSLAMFEALRGLRDAVAPVSGEIMQEKNDDEVDDQDLVSKLAHTVLEQSQTIQRRIDAIPGLHRSRNEQMGRIAELVEENRVAQEELEGCYTRALAQRSQCRTFLQDNTEKALGLSS